MSDFFELPVVPFRGEVAVVAPSSPFDRQHFNAGITKMKLNKIKPIIPRSLFSKRGYLAGSDEERVDLLIEALTDDRYKAVWAARGGYGALRLLPILEKRIDTLQRNPKFLIGFSDISVLHSFLVEKCGFVTVHGPNVTTLSTVDSYSERQVFHLIQGEENALEIRFPKLQVVSPGRVSGVVKGGNLSSLVSMIGTPWQPDFTGAILVLEDVGEVPYKVDRLLTHMRLAGMFKGVKGVVLGQFTYREYRPPATKHIDERRIVELMGLPSNIPVVSRFPVGHGKQNMAFLLGAEATLDTDKKLLSYL